MIPVYGWGGVVLKIDALGMDATFTTKNSYAKNPKFVPVVWEQETDNGKALREVDGHDVVISCKLWNQTLDDAQVFEDLINLVNYHLATGVPIAVYPKGLDNPHWDCELVSPWQLNNVDKRVAVGQVIELEFESVAMVDGIGYRVDIERTGLIFNLDASDISKLYRNTANQGYNPVYVQATVNNVVNRIVAMNGGVDINLETPTLNEAYVLKQDVNGKYYLSADPNNTIGFVAYTINRAALASAPTIVSNNNLIVMTWGSTSDGHAIILSLSGATGPIAVGRYNNEYYAGNIVSGLKYALSGISPMQVRAINNKENNWFAFDGLAEKTASGGSYAYGNIATIGGRILNSANKYNLMGIQIYSGLTNSVADKAKALEIVKKARAYYGVA